MLTLENNIINVDDIKNYLITVRNEIVLLDSHLAELYEVETKTLNRAVKRNIMRFPVEFRFQLTEIEWSNIKSHFEKNNHNNALRYQIGTLNLEDNLESNRGKHRKYLPYAFTEQGVAMLSAVLRSDIAITTSIQIINAFVSMRRFLNDNAEIFRRLTSLEMNQISTNEKISKIFDEINNKLIPANQGIFFDGQIFDAWKFVSDLIRTANISIILIDNYIDDRVINLFSKISKNIKIKIYTSNLNRQIITDIEKFNSQYQVIELIELKKSHDRFIIIDNCKIYHIGASLKDLGKKWFAFSLLEMDANLIIDKLS